VVLKNPTEEVFTSIQAAREAGAVVLGYGLFLNAIIALLIVAAALFMVVKGVNKMKAMAVKKEEEAAAKEPAAPSETELLSEIRDLLKK
jgi:large conductance mechanosensitive channel